MSENDSIQRLTVETPESVAFAFDLADVGSRGLAIFLDSVFLGILLFAELMLAIAAINLPLAQESPSPNLFAWIVGIAAVVMFVTYWSYFVLGEVAWNGRTPGKRIVGIRVVRDDGSRVAVLDSVIRTLLRLVDALPSWYAVGVACALLSRRHKRLGDMAAGTVVVRDTGELSLTFEGGRSRPEVLLAREFLRRRGQMTEAARYQVGSEMLRALGEQPGEWDEPTIAGRLADLTGMREDLAVEGASE